MKYKIRCFFDQKSLPIIFILLFTILPLFWYHPGKIMTGADLHYPLDAKHDLMSRTFVWNDIFLAGTDRSMDMTGLPFSSVGFVLDELGFSIEIAQIIYLCFLSFCISFSIYYLASKLFQKNQLAIFTTILFYSISYYNFHNFEIIRIGEISGMILLPILLGICYNVIISNSTSIKDLFILSFFSLFCGGVGIQPPVFIIVFGFTMVFCIHYIIKTYKRKYRLYFEVLLKLILVPLIFVVLNFYWIFPVVFYTLQANYTSSANSIDVFGVFSLLEWTSIHSDFLNIFKFLPRTVWFSTWADQPYYPEIVSWNNLNMPIIGIFTFILPLLTLLLSKNNLNRNESDKKDFNYFDTLFYSFILFMTMFFIKGLHEPFGNIYRWFVINVPAFWMYRAPYEKFGLLFTLLFSLLIGKFIYEFCEWCNPKVLLKKKYSLLKRIYASKKIFFISSFILLIAFNLLFHYPYLAGEMIPSSEGEDGYHQYFNVGYYQEFPRYLFEASEWIKNDTEHYNIMLLPDQKTHVYSWGYGSATDITFYLFNKGLLFRQFGYGTAPPSSIDLMYDIVQQNFYQDTNVNLFKILRKLNVKYLLQRNDFLYDFYVGEGKYLPAMGDSPEFIKERFSMQNNISKIKSFGEWDFYEVYDNNEDGFIYKSNEFIVLDQETDIKDFLIYCDKTYERQDFYYKTDLNEFIAVKGEGSRNFNDHLINHTEHIFYGNVPGEINLTFNDGMKGISLYYASKSTMTNICQESFIVDDGENTFLRSSNSCENSHLNQRQNLNIYDFRDFSYSFKYRLHNYSPPGGLQLHLNFTDSNKTTYNLYHNLFFVEYPPKIEFISENQTLINTYDYGIRDGSWGIVKIEPYVLLSMLENTSNYWNVTSIDVNLINWAGNKMVVDIDDINVQGISTVSCFPNPSYNSSPISTKLNYVKLNPTHYEIIVENLDSFVLVFSQLYNPNWEVYLEPLEKSESVAQSSNNFEHKPKDVKYLFVKPYNDYHFKINGFANAWYIDKNDFCKSVAGDCDYKIIIHFKTQSFFYLGIIFSIIFFVLVLFFFFVKKLKSKRFEGS